MSAPLLRTLILLALGLIAGSSIVWMLMGNERHTWRYRLLALASSAGALLIWWRAGAGVWAWLALAGFLAGSAAGYAWRAHRLLNRDDDRESPLLVEPAAWTTSASPALIYFTQGEPENYDPTGLLSRYRQADRMSLPAMPLLLRPFMARRMRECYRRFGPSRSREIHRSTIKAVRQTLLEQGGAASGYYLSFAEAEPRPDAALIHALNDGAREIVVCEAFVARDLSTRTGVAWMQALLEGAGVDAAIRFTGPIGESPRLGQCYVERARAVTNGVAREETAVVVVGRGEPAAWTAHWPQQAASEGQTLRRVADAFVAAGWPGPNVTIAWSDYGAPRLTKALQDVAARGASHLLIAPVTSTADDWHLRDAIPRALRRAQFSSGTQIHILGAWNADPLMVQAIVEAWQAAIRSDDAPPSLILKAPER